MPQRKALIFSQSWVKPLKAQSDVIPDQKRREEFVNQVFWNFQDVLAVNHVLAERLTKRQKQQPVVQKIGDLFLERAPQFDPFVAYGSHQLFGKFEFEKEKGNNPAFQRFVDVSTFLLQLVYFVDWTLRKPRGSRNLESSSSTVT